MTTFIFVSKIDENVTRYRICGIFGDSLEVDKNGGKKSLHWSMWTGYKD